MTPEVEIPGTLKLSLGSLHQRVDTRLGVWQRQRFVERLWQRDFTLWSAEEVPELTNRLGWLELPEVMAGELGALQSLALDLLGDGIQKVVLLGMGGSSLAPEVFARVFGSGPGHPGLEIFDSTHPEAVRALTDSLDPKVTAFFVSSKSGTTTETRALFSYFWQWASEAHTEPGRHFVAITDRGSPLSELAREQRFRAVVAAPADVGGRFSALSHFGLAPAAILGVDLTRILASASEMAQACSGSSSVDNPGLVLGAVLAEATLAGRDKLTLLATRSLLSLPDWIEQLVAESTGKAGQGIVPVVREPAMDPSRHGGDRLFVCLALDGEVDEELEERLRRIEGAGHPVARIVLPDRYAIAAEFFRWEVAVAAAAAALGVQPFNQPDVQIAKEMAARDMEEAPDCASSAADSLPLPVGDALTLRRAVVEWLESRQESDYFAVLAFLAPSPETTRALARLQGGLLEKTGCATTLGYGPRFLHSTGQLHKGGPDRGLFLQLVDRPPTDLAVPESGYGFARLIGAQAAGDAQALIRCGRRTLRVELGDDVTDGVARLLEILGV